MKNFLGPGDDILVEAGDRPHYSSPEGSASMGLGYKESLTSTVTPRYSKKTRQQPDRYAAVRNSSLGCSVSIDMIRSLIVIMNLLPVVTLVYIQKLLGPADLHECHNRLILILF